MTPLVTFSAASRPFDHCQTAPMSNNMPTQQPKNIFELHKKGISELLSAACHMISVISHYTVLLVTRRRWMNTPYLKHSQAEWKAELTCLNGWRWFTSMVQRWSPIQVLNGHSVGQLCWSDTTRPCCDHFSMVGGIITDISSECSDHRLTTSNNSRHSSST